MLVNLLQLFSQSQMVKICTQRMKRRRSEKQPLNQSITETFNLGDGVFMDILSRLSVKSIFSCKKLSKHWNTSISTTYFYKLQLAQSRKKQSYIVSPTMETPMKLYSMDSKNNFKLSPLNTINPPERSHDDESMYMITSFHGLICCVNLISDENVDSKFCDLQIWICNPCTGKTLLLPQGTPSSFEIEPSIGVAYDSNISDYRIFRIFCVGVKIPEEKVGVVGYEFREGLLVAKYQYALAYECEVYSSNTGCWKNIGSVPCIPSSQRPYRTGHIFVGGKIYWLVSVKEQGEILSVDLEGRFEVINLPKYIDGHGEDQIEDSTYLINLQGSLGLLVQHPGWMDIWVREDEGSWVLKLEDRMPIKDDDEVVVAVTSLKNQVMCVADRHWYVYDVETGKWKKKRGPRTGFVNPAVFPLTESILPCEGGVPCRRNTKNFFFCVMGNTGFYSGSFSSLFMLFFGFKK